jgi:hypothetical protein
MEAYLTGRPGRALIYEIRFEKAPMTETPRGCVIKKIKKIV